MKYKQKEIGRGLVHARIRRKRAGVYVLELRGDRGTIDLVLSEEEAREILTKQRWDDAPDSLGFTFQLVEGTVKKLLDQFREIAKPEET